MDGRHARSPRRPASAGRGAARAFCRTYTALRVRIPRPAAERLMVLAVGTRPLSARSLRRVVSLRRLGDRHHGTKAGPTRERAPGNTIAPIAKDGGHRNTGWRDRP